MTTTITGLHHITAIASDPQTNLNFYSGLLGLRLVKRTVNFDDPSAYHLYYGDETGSPGSVITFFYWPRGARHGRIGSAQATSLTFSIHPQSLDFWEKRLREHDCECRRADRFGESLLQLYDPDHIPIEIVTTSDDSRLGWGGTDIPHEHALRGLHSAVLTLNNAEATTELLTSVMGFRPVAEEGNRSRYEVAAGGPGAYTDLVINPDMPHGIDGIGTIHHVAWAVRDNSAQAEIRRGILSTGLPTSDVRNRDYFRSIYYREPSGILFEIATEIPGFTVDEPLERLGHELRIPKHFAHLRSTIEGKLPSLHPPYP